MNASMSGHIIVIYPKLKWW